MTAVRRKSAIGLAVLLAAATAAADTVITADEVISCSVVSADANSVLLKLPRARRRTLPTRDIYEIRLSDWFRVDKLAARLPQLRVTLDSGQSIPPPELRTREATRLGPDRSLDLRVEGLPGHPDILDTLARKTSPGRMAARCRDMEVALRDHGPGDETAAGLLREVKQEAWVLRGLWPGSRTYLYAAGGGLLGGAIGCGVGEAIRPAGCVGVSGALYGLDLGGIPVGTGVGCAAGFLIGATIGIWRREVLVARHRDRVNDLVRRVNRAIASRP